MRFQSHPRRRRASVKLRMDSTSASDVGQSVVIQKLLNRITSEHADKVGDYTRSWPQDWREAGKRWLGSTTGRRTYKPSSRRLAAHAAIMAVIAVATAPGDKIAFEQLTISSISRSANLIGRRSVVFGNDKNGADPEDFERLCAQQHPKVVFLMPSMQNPTLSSCRMTACGNRRGRSQVQCLDHRGFDLQLPAGANSRARSPRLRRSGCFTSAACRRPCPAGVRAGWVACPAHFAPRVQTAHKMVTGGISFMLAQLAADMVNSGEADTIRAKVRKEIAAREEMARRIFAGLDFQSHRNVPYLWMKLPEPWLSGTFKQVAANEGVLVDDEDEYKPARGEKTCTIASASASRSRRPARMSQQGSRRSAG